MRDARSGLLRAAMAAAIALGGTAGAAAAHHSFAMFDRTKQVTVTGTVREFQWTNPHVFIELQAADGPWSVECGSTNMLFRAGWSPTSFKAGDKVTVVVNPLRDGRKGGAFVWAKLADGSTLGNLNAVGGPG